MMLKKVMAGLKTKKAALSDRFLHFMFCLKKINEKKVFFFVKKEIFWPKINNENCFFSNLKRFFLCVYGGGGGIKLLRRIHTIKKKPI
jgi:hypothetical protein